MFENKNTFSDETIKSYNIIIVCCDKMTYKVAHNLHGKIPMHSTADIVSVVWQKQDYEANQSHLTSRNKLIFLGKDFAEEYVTSPDEKGCFNEFGVHIKKDANHLVIYTEKTDEESIHSIMEKMYAGKEEKEKINILNTVLATAGIAFAGGLVGVGIFGLYKWIVKTTKRNRIKTSWQYSYALSILEDKFLDDYVKGSKKTNVENEVKDDEAEL